MTKPKFPMHDMHLHKSFRIVATAVGLSITSGILFYCLHTLPLKADYKNFYATYDPMASFYRMRDGGYLDSCPPVSKEAGKKK